MRRFLLIVLIGFSAAVSAQELPAELQKRYNGLIAELRCVVCQNQSLAESNVPLAKDLRATVSEQLLTGKSNREIKDYLVNRYGEFVLYRPRFSLKTLFLWVVPPLLLLGGLFAIVKSRRRVKPQALSEAEQARLNALLANNEK